MTKKAKKRKGDRGDGGSRAEGEELSLRLTAAVAEPGERSDWRMPASLPELVGRSWDLRSLVGVGLEAERPPLFP